MYDSCPIQVRYICMFKTLLLKNVRRENSLSWFHLSFIEIIPSRKEHARCGQAPRDYDNLLCFTHLAVCLGLPFGNPPQVTWQPDCSHDTPTNTSSRKPTIYKSSVVFGHVSYRFKKNMICIIFLAKYLPTVHLLCLQFLSVHKYIIYKLMKTKYVLAPQHATEPFNNAFPLQCCTGTGIPIIKLSLECLIFIMRVSILIISHILLFWNYVWRTKSILIRKSQIYAPVSVAIYSVTIWVKLYSDNKVAVLYNLDYECLDI